MVKKAVTSALKVRKKKRTRVVATYIHESRDEDETFSIDLIYRINLEDFE